MKLCIDPGHGLSNRTPGVYDSGAVGGVYEEAGCALVWAHCLRKACEALGITVYMTRTTRADAAPVQSRARWALDRACTHLVSLHLNCHDTPQANGYETLYRTKNSKVFAEGLHPIVCAALGLKDRGVKPRPDLAVLGSPDLKSALLELGFISNRSDMLRVASETVMQATCQKLAAHLAAHA